MSVKKLFAGPFSLLILGNMASVRQIAGGTSWTWSRESGRADSRDLDTKCTEQRSNCLVWNEYASVSLWVGDADGEVSGVCSWRTQ